MNQVEALDKDTPLRDDIRLLGRLLGDTVRDQEGEAVYDNVERIRQTSIRFHRDEDETARGELETTLNCAFRRAGDRDHPRLQLFLAPRQHRRGPAPHPPLPRACPGRIAAPAMARSPHALDARPRGRDPRR